MGARVRTKTFNLGIQTQRRSKMPKIDIQMKSISAEKFWESDEPMPSEVHVSTNLNVVGLNSKEDFLSIPFVVTIGYNPSIAQISLKGEAEVKGEKIELNEIQQKYEKDEKPPQPLIQNIINKSLVEATMVSRTLNIPPPVPLPSPQPRGKSEKSGDLNYVG